MMPSAPAYSLPSPGHECELGISRAHMPKGVDPMSSYRSIFFVYKRFGGKNEV